jgi:chromosome segregation ATPase
VSNGNDGLARIGTVEESIGYIRGVVQSLPGKIDNLDQRIDSFKENQNMLHSATDRNLDRHNDQIQQLSEELDLLNKYREEDRKEIGRLAAKTELNTEFRIKKQESTSFVKKNATTLIISFCTIVISTTWTYTCSLIANIISKLFGGP